MALYDDMGIEVIKGTIAFGTARPRAVIETLNLIVSAPWMLFDCISRKRKWAIGIRDEAGECCLVSECHFPIFCSLNGLENGG